MAESPAAPVPGTGLSRRTLLRAGGLGAVATALSGCSVLASTAGVGDNVRVGVPWSAAELEAFRKVLTRYRDGYELVPLGDDIASALGARTAGRPDVVAMPQPGTVSASIDALEPLPDELWRREYERIMDRLDPRIAGDGPAIRRSRSSSRTPRWSGIASSSSTSTTCSQPGTCSDWMELNQRIIDDPALSDAGIAPLALGCADSWLLAVSFENVLLRHFLDTYDELGDPSADPRLWRGADVEEALYMLAEMWSEAGAVSGGLDRALVLQYPDAVQEVFQYGRAAMVVAPDYAESVIRRFGVPAAEVGTFTFPAREGTTASLAVAGDLLVVAKPARESAWDLLRYLTNPRTPLPWIENTGGFIAATPDTPDKYSDIEGDLADEVHQQDIRFRLSDLLGPVVRDGLGRVLQQLVRALADDTPPATAARAACRQMVTIAEGA